MTSSDRFTKRAPRASLFALTCAIITTIAAAPAYGQTVSFADYFPLDPEKYCTKTFEMTFNGSGQWTSEVFGTITVPYTSGAKSGVTIINPNPHDPSQRGLLVGGFSDGIGIRFLSLGDYYVSTDCSLSDNPLLAWYGILQDGTIIEEQTFYLVKNDLSECQQAQASSVLVDIQDVTVQEGHYEGAVILWTIDRNHLFTPLNFFGKEADLGIVFPTSPDTGGYSITGFEAHGLGRGLIMAGDVSAGSGELNDLLELTSVSCRCTVELALTYTGDTLNIDADLGTLHPATWNAWLSSHDDAIPLWSLPTPLVDPAASFSFAIPRVPSLGNIGILTTLTTPQGGTMCSDWRTVVTGPLAPGEEGRRAQDLRGVVRHSGIEWQVREALGRMSPD